MKGWKRNQLKKEEEYYNVGYNEGGKIQGKRNNAICESNHGIHEL